MALHFAMPVSFGSFSGIMEIIEVFIDSGGSFFSKKIWFINSLKSFFIMGQNLR